MKEDFIEKLKENIKKGGFPTELEVAQVFNKRKWNTKHNTYFIDKDQNKSREIDLISDFTFIERTSNNYSEYTLRIIVEIKQEKNKPWIIFSSESTPFEKTIYQYGPDRVSNNFENNSLIRSLGKHYKELDGKVGRSFTEGFSSGKDKIFNSLCNVTKALLFAKENIRKDTSSDKILCYLIPTIVIKGELFEAFFNENQELELAEKNHIQFCFNYLSENYKEKNIGHIINIIKYEYLETFLKQQESMHSKIFNENK